jgi:hypothetical protein
LSDFIAFAEDLEELNDCWTPHPKQIEVGRDFFYLGKKDVFCSWGRNTGKTDIAAYCLWRWAKENPNSQSYYFAPEQKQAKEILWAAKRLQNFGPESWIESINNTEMRMTLTNGSFIKVDGSDNFESYRGIKPNGFIVYEELKDMDPRFIDAFDPNRLAFMIPALWIGTPPDHENHFVHFMNMFKERGCFYKATSYDNPHNSVDWLNAKRDELIARGEYETWLREYMAEYVKGGKNHLLPQAIDLPVGCDLPIDLNRWSLFVIYDPASSSTFAVLFVLFNPYSRKIKVMHEIYEQDTAKMTARQIALSCDPHIETYLKKVKGIEHHYDEAATWFANEMSEARPSWWMTPTSKAKSDKESGLSMMRDLMIKKQVEVSADCVKFRWEMENYVKDKNGKIPKKDDHLIDCFRYFLDAAGFTFNEEPIPKELDPLLAKRGYRIEDDFVDMNPMMEIDSYAQESEE